MLCHLHSAQLLKLWLVNHLGHDSLLLNEWVCVSAPSRRSGQRFISLSLYEEADQGTGLRQTQHVVLYKLLWTSTSCRDVMLLTVFGRRQMPCGGTKLVCVGCGVLLLILYQQMNCVALISHAHVSWQMCGGKWCDDGCWRETHRLCEC